jgi:hypothetical protein
VTSDDKDATRINAAHAEAENADGEAAEKKLIVAEMLANKRAQLKRGEWIPYVREHLAFDVRQAQRYLELHRGREKLRNPKTRWRTFREVEELLGRPPREPRATNPREPAGPHQAERKALRDLAKDLARRT